MVSRKRKAHSFRMNNKRWCTKKDEISGSSSATNVLNSNLRLQNISLVDDNIKDSHAEDYIMVNFAQISKLFLNLKCPVCEMQTLKLELGTKLGFSYNLNLTCDSCDKKVNSINSSCERNGNTVPDINLRVTQAFLETGKGYSAIEKFCMVMNIQPFSSRTFNKCVKSLDSAYASSLKNVLKKVHDDIKRTYQTISPNSDEIKDICVTFDGSWLTRGHSSLIGVGCVIDIHTGYVVDFEVMSKVCRHCSVAEREFGKSSAEFNIWYEGHKSACDRNHSGTSGAMEMEAALILWKRSVSLGFRYTTLLSDGDCKTFKFLSERNVYGPDVKIKKEECINHVSKRLGTALRTTVKEWRARGVTLGGKAHGSLSETTIKKLTVYYQRAILQNKGDATGMKRAIYATLYHSISTDKKPQHSKCPVGVNSWCFYQAALARGDNPGSHKLRVGTPIKEAFLPKILPIYQRLASSELLERCVRCGTQNANESLHSVIWAKCPKEKFVHRQRVKLCVSTAVCEFNMGTMHTITEVQNVLGMNVGHSTKKLGVMLDSRKFLFRKRRNNAKYQLARKIVKNAIRKREQLSRKREGVTYSAGCF